jgi:uncharacterized membrane protein
LAAPDLSIRSDRMHFTLSVDIQAPPDVVWAVWSDVERWPEWTAGVSRVDVLARGERPEAAAGPLAVGTRVRIRQPKFPPAVWQVTEVEENRRFTWVSVSPGAHVTGSHTIEPHAGGSRATLALTFAGPIARLVGWLSRSLTERYLHLEADGLKARSEQRARSRG